MYFGQGRKENVDRHILLVFRGPGAQLQPAVIGRQQFIRRDHPPPTTNYTPALKNVNYITYFDSCVTTDNAKSVIFTLNQYVYKLQAGQNRTTKNMAPYTLHPVTHPKVKLWQVKPLQPQMP